jgi:hypothetical protein
MFRRRLVWKSVSVGALVALVVTSQSRPPARRASQGRLKGSIVDQTGAAYQA